MRFRVRWGNSETSRVLLVVRRYANKGHSDPNYAEPLVFLQVLADLVRHGWH